MQIGDNLHEMSKSILYDKREKNVLKLSSAKFAQTVVKAK